MGNQSSTCCDIMLFGALGNLATRKLLPAFYHLERAGLLHPQTRILLLAREPMAAEPARQRFAELINSRVMPAEQDEACLAKLMARIAYSPLDFAAAEGYRALAGWRGESTERPLVLYLATPPSVYGVIADQLGRTGICGPSARVVVEKPVGHDFASSCEINDRLAAVFEERQVFRMDHYLGKETVQNLIALRFANNLFASQWNQDHISHVEITVAESVGIEGRWGYFDQAGQMRDMVQSHLLQLLCLIAMDPPADLSADSIRDEKVKVLRALKPIAGDVPNDQLVMGQYTAGSVAGQPVPGYLEEAGANPQSLTETFVSIKAEILNWRWAGVPFYLRTGKRLPEKVSQIIIHFKPAPHYIFDPDQRHLAGNRLIIRLQPDEGMALQILTKEQGLDQGFRLRQGPLELTFAEAFDQTRVPDAYERLLWEVIQGNQYLFVRRDEVEYAWRWVDQILAAVARRAEPPKRYAAGTWGPVASVAMVARDGRSWHEDN
ncbi:MAG: glucose-6-phosphate dehydrogenase [Marinobacter sp.]|nr:glucose-6-phosphate dehydrogenase [Marinobacter sp.]